MENSFDNSDYLDDSVCALLVKKKGRGVIQSDSDDTGSEDTSDFIQSSVADSFDERGEAAVLNLSNNADTSAIEEGEKSLLAHSNPEIGECSADVSEEDEEDEDIVHSGSETEEVFHKSAFRDQSQGSDSLEDVIEDSPSVSEDESNEDGLDKWPSVVEVSSDEDQALVSGNADSVPAFSHPKDQNVTVSEEKYQEQVERIQTIETEFARAQNTLKLVNMSLLPDKGKTLIEKEKFLRQKLELEREKLKNMSVLPTEQPQKTALNKIEIAWNDIEAGANAIGPRTFGKKGLEKFRVEKNMALDTLDSIHRSLEACPGENDAEEDPKGLRVPLMPHQKRALAWLLWRERSKPSGGILADDMGLGKTLTMIALVIKSLELEDKENQEDEEEHRDKYQGGTLVICPASLLNQWESEIQKRTKRGLLSLELYHGAKRETKAKRLARHDIVLTTYSLVMNDLEKNGAVFGVRWFRIIMDEAHQIRNYKSKTAEAAFRLSARSRWALTGTPIHNKELDMYALLKFLRCSPFDDLQVWKRWCSDKSTGGATRLHAVTSSLMLRRTKVELMSNGVLKALPERKWELVRVELDKEELQVYHKVLIFSRTLFAQFLHQRAMNNQDRADLEYNGVAAAAPNNEYFQMRNKLLRLHRVKNVSQHEILVLLLRLRQICCHPFLITKMLQGDEDLGNAETEEESEEMNLLEQLNKLNLNDEDHANVAADASAEACGLKEASKGFLNPSNPVFAEDRPSSKLKILINLVKEKILTNDKAIIVSQWTSLLQLIGIHLKRERIIYDVLDGTIPVNKRMPIVDRLNDPHSDTRVLLLSLTAGGVGLNLVGANHLFLLDLHWNPQLENQAQDRIYRMGQTKPIFVYKFMAAETIEERIKLLQDRKLGIAESVLTGSKKVSSSKLTLQDLKMLFEFK